MEVPAAQTREFQGTVSLVEKLEAGVHAVGY